MSPITVLLSHLSVGRAVPQYTAKQNITASIEIEFLLLVIVLSLFSFSTVGYRVVLCYCLVFEATRAHFYTKHLSKLRDSAKNSY